VREEIVQMRRKRDQQLRLVFAGELFRRVAGGRQAIPQPGVRLAQKFDKSAIQGTQRLAIVQIAEIGTEAKLKRRRVPRGRSHGF
jgi:hypothetical protein